MSEYQYYEFLALDCPLSRQQQEELRRVSSRARINATSFVNFYNFGDLRAEPDNLIAQYFDVFVYIANWGSASLSIKIPKPFIQKSILVSFLVDDVFSYFSSGSNWILSWNIPENDNYERCDLESGEGWMTRLLGLRDELMNGDFRSLYLGWLCAATFGEVASKSKEPMVVPGLAHLTTSQIALAEFIEIDCDLIAGAATDNIGINQDSPEEVDNWLNQLSKEECLNFIKSFLNGSAKLEQVKLKQVNRQWCNDKNEITQAERRTLKEINILKNNARDKRLQQEEIDRENELKLARKERKKYLNEIYARANPNWKTSVFHIEKGTARGYEDAVALLCNLKDAYQQNGASGKYQNMLNQLMQPYQKKRALLRRLKESQLI